MKLNLKIAFVFVVLGLVACGGAKLSLPFNQARAGFKTHLLDKDLRDLEEPETPPDFVDLVQYPTELGPMNAYLVVPESESDELQPAIIWITGGFGNGIGSTVWEPQDPDNDQSASAFWSNGVITMYPALRGGSGNPGSQEQFLGEVDDVLAAADYLAKRPEVDPNRIFLGGHSTGGTLALLVAASSKRFRAVFSFGPVGDVRGYGPDLLNFPINRKAEWQYRSPMFWLRDIQSPTWVMEGAEEDSNISELKIMQNSPHNDKVHFRPYPKKDHFSILAPVTWELAKRIRIDSTDEPQFSMTF